VDNKVCALCPAFLHDPESLRKGLCFGCRQPPGQFLQTPAGPVERFPRGHPMRKENWIEPKIPVDNPPASA